MTEIYLHIVARMADYIDTHPYLGGFKMPGESMLIERLMASFARRFFDLNPQFVHHMTGAWLVPAWWQPLTMAPSALRYLSRFTI